MVIGGDLNATPDERAMRWLADRYWDVWAAVAPRHAAGGSGGTFPALDPSARIDYLFASAGLRVTSAGVPVRAAEASDHLPVVAELEVED